jgi:hypothetical protein
MPAGAATTAGAPPRRRPLGAPPGRGLHAERPPERVELPARVPRLAHLLGPLGIQRRASGMEAHLLHALQVGRRRRRRVRPLRPLGALLHLGRQGPGRADKPGHRRRWVGGQQKCEWLGTCTAARHVLSVHVLKHVHALARFTHTRTRTRHAHAHAHAHAHTHTHTRTHAHTHTTHTHTRACTHARTRTHARTHAHTHASKHKHPPCTTLAPARRRCLPRLDARGGGHLQEDVVERRRPHQEGVVKAASRWQLRAQAGQERAHVLDRHRGLREHFGCDAASCGAGRQGRQGSRCGARAPMGTGSAQRHGRRIACGGPHLTPRLAPPSRIALLPRQTTKSTPAARPQSSAGRWAASSLCRPHRMWTAPGSGRAA